MRAASCTTTKHLPPHTSIVVLSSLAMPITPHFSLTQTDTHIELNIRVPHVRVTAESIQVVVDDDQVVHFSAPPCYLLPRPPSTAPSAFTPRRPKPVPNTSLPLKTGQFSCHSRKNNLVFGKIWICWGNGRLPSPSVYGGCSKYRITARQTKPTRPEQMA